MAEDNENTNSQHEGIHGGVEASALESAASYVAAGARAGSSGNAGGKGFINAFSALMDWGIKNALIREESAFEFLKTKPDGHGREHEAWFDEPSNRWFKATYPNSFGLPWGRTGSATADEYLVRLNLHNEFFGDDIRLVALVNCGGKLRVLTTQPHAPGAHAAQDEINQWLAQRGFIRLVHECGSAAWYNKVDDLMVADAHEGNLIRTDQGRLVPIDLNIVHPNGELRDWALRSVLALDCIGPDSSSDQSLT